MMKPDNRAKAGLLQPLEVPSRKWMHVTMDLVIDLSASNGFMAIVVFIDKLTKMVHLTGCKIEFTAMEYAQIFVDNIFRLQVIISDWDSRFTSKFCRPLFDLLCTISSSILCFIHKHMNSWSR